MKTWQTFAFLIVTRMYEERRLLYSAPAQQAAKESEQKPSRSRESPAELAISLYYAKGPILVIAAIVFFVMGWSLGGSEEHFAG